MKKIIFLNLILALSVIVACDNAPKEASVETSVVDVNSLNLENLMKEIRKREEIFKNKETVDAKSGVLLMEAYVAFEDRFGNREHAAEFLFKAGEIAMGVNRPVDAIRYLDKLYNGHPDFDKRAYGLFLKAFVLENQVFNLDEAKLTYELFLTEFPAHEMADDARASIENLGKSPEQIIREFEIRDSLAKVNGEV